jgi:peptide/nickel transport system ATP-binding protein
VDRPATPLLAVRDLAVAFDVDGTAQSAVREVSFEIARGEVVALVGESGSGKTVTALALLGLLPGNAAVTGSIEFDAQDLGSLSERERRRTRGRRIGMVFQDPVAALDPVFTVGYQMGEVVRLAEPKLTRAQVSERCIDLLSLVDIPDPAQRLRAYPHQFSGGQAQRIAIAMMLAHSPDLIVADEPTTALDVTVQAEILDVLREVRRRLDSAILLITHNMGVVADLADRVLVMRAGRLVEDSPVDNLFVHPKADYTRALLSAVPRLGGPKDGSRAQSAAPRGDGPTVRVGAGRPPAALVGHTSGEANRGADAPASSTREAVLEIWGLTVEYGGRLRGRMRAVDDVNLRAMRGQIVGLVGESGSGKTTLGRAVVGLAPLTGGTIAVEGRDVGGIQRRERQAMRRRVGVVFQNPATSLNPRHAVAQTVREPLRVLGGMSRADAAERADELLAAVGLGGRWRERYPHELSGGQRQRVAIARAVALDPALLIADEPTSALDVSVQAQVLDVFRELQARLGFACLFISHDLAVVDTLADWVAVMHRGRIVEQGDRRRVLSAPVDPYTRQLVASAPVPDPVAQRERRQARLEMASS